MKYFLLISFFSLIPLLGINAQSENYPNKKGNRHELIVKYMEEKKSYLKQCIPLSEALSFQ